MKYPIAIIDYGIGGLGLYKMIREEFSDMPLIYFSDSGETPYGKLSKQVLRARLEKVFDFLRRRGAERIVVACHSASSVVFDSDKDVIGIRMQTLKAVAKRKPTHVGIIGGGRTIRSGFYKRELNKEGIRTSQRVAQPLSILVERGEIDTPLVHRTVASIIKPLRSCNSILLACTHYPVLNNVIAKYSNAYLIDPADELYRSIYKYLNKDLKGHAEFFTTGNKSLMIKAALSAFGVKIEAAKKVAL